MWDVGYQKKRSRDHAWAVQQRGFGFTLFPVWSLYKTMCERSLQKLGGLRRFSDRLLSFSCLFLSFLAPDSFLSWRRGRESGEEHYSGRVWPKSLTATQRRKRRLKAKFKSEVPEGLKLRLQLRPPEKEHVCSDCTPASENGISTILKYFSRGLE